MSNPSVISTPQLNAGVPFATFIPSGANPTPQQIAECQDVSIDVSITRKLLQGSKLFAIASADVDGKITGKIKAAKVVGAALGAALGGATLTAAQNKQTVENGTITAGAVTVTGSANFVRDLGVRGTSGKVYVCVASAPAVGQYSFSAGVYTFNTSDNGTVVVISYVQSVASTGQTLTIGNPQTGLSTTWELDVGNYTPGNNSKVLLARFPAVVIPKITLPFKNNDFTTMDIDFEALDDGTGNVGYIYSE